jgi:hypothetical protein
MHVLCLKLSFEAFGLYLYQLNSLCVAPNALQTCAVANEQGVLTYGVRGVLATIDTLFSYRDDVDQIYRDSMKRSLCATLGRAPRDDVSHSSFGAGLAHAIHVISS